jgi:two-component system alkaline phosphatase synthesis response regulator PhoP
MQKNTRKKILLVDDDVDVLEQNKILLEAHGYITVTAESMEEGWRLFLKEKPDAAIVDLIMEEHDSGFVLSHRIKKDLHGCNIPVIILTSAAYITGYKFDVSTNEEREWINCDGVVNKPIVFEELRQKLESFFHENSAV